MTRVQKMWSPPARPGRRVQEAMERQTREKGGTKGKNKGDKNGRQSKERLTLTFTDGGCLFMKLMKRANEEDWIFFLATLNVTTTREFTTMRQGAFAKQSPYLGRGATSQLVSKEGTSCVIAPLHVQTEERRLNVWNQTYTDGDAGKTALLHSFFPHVLEIAQPDYTRDSTALGIIRTLSRIDRIFNKTTYG